MEYSYSFLILLLPLLSFLLLGLGGKYMKKPVAGVIGTVLPSAVGPTASIRRSPSSTSPG